MTAYRVRNWEKHFENNRSKTVAKLSWVPIPNSHDGEGFATIMAHKDAAEIFTAWVLILQVASRCQPRGSLLREGGKPHDCASLALRTRGQQKWFEKAMPILLEVRWLEDFALACQSNGSQLPPACQSGDEGKKEGMEGKEPLNPQEASASPPLVVEKDVLPTAEEAKAISILFHRKLTTAWAEKEIAAYKKLMKRGVITQDAIVLISAYYTHERAKEGNGMHRRDLQTFLNNFDSELDRAKAFNQNPNAHDKRTHIGSGSGRNAGHNADADYSQRPDRTPKTSHWSA